MTVPQAFTRLCNAVLIAEHLDDFLPIDEDRGNDGYLKSEKRMFAVHCFRRGQNKALDTPIRTKMVGDLGKAIALKRAGIWDVEAWTFLSNYPISDTIGAQLVAFGCDAGIDVSWRGPDYLANALQNHTEVVARFPALQVNALAAQLAEIQEMLGAKAEAGDEEATRRFAVPRTPGDHERLLRVRPSGWEYLLFAGVLQRGVDALDAKVHDHELGLPRRPRFYLEDDDVAQFLSRAFARLGAIVEPVPRIFDPRAQEVAFGALGESGDALRIERFGQWIVDAYGDMLDWAAEIRTAIVGGGLARTLDLAGQGADEVIDEMRRFIEDAVASISRIPEDPADPEADPFSARLEPVLTVNDKLMAETIAELRRAHGL
jgi:hypothetical protein